MLLLGSSYAWADFSLKDWQYEKNIILQAPSQSGLVELSFDEEVFAKASPGLRDIRIIGGEGVEVPYKLLVERRAVERSRLSGRVLDTSFVEGQYSSFVVDLGEGGLFHNQVEVNSTSKNFRREVAVEGSSDANTWAVLQNKAVIYDYTDKEAELKARNTKIRYAESTARYVRVKIINHDEEPLSISGAMVFYEKKTEAKTVSYPSSIIEQSIDKEYRASVITVDLGSSNLPNNTVSIVVSDVNFQRDIGIEGSNDREKWRVVKLRDVIFSFATPKFTGSKLQITYPEHTYRYLRLTIFNGDNLPLNIGRVSVSGILRKFVFEAAQGAAYKLFYGNPDARYPQYDIERYFQYLETENLPRASLGAQRENPFFEAKVTPLPPVSERYPWLLPTVLLVSIVALFGLLFRIFWTVRKKLLPPNEDGS